MKRIWIAISLLLLFALRASRATLPAFAAHSDVGILVMAHGGSSRWNKTVEQAVKTAHLDAPVRVFFGMGTSPGEVKALQNDVKALEAQGAEQIVVVPLLVSSYSDVYRQWRYLLGVSATPGFSPAAAGAMRHSMQEMGSDSHFADYTLFPVEHQANIRFTPPLDDDPIVSDILYDHAAAISPDAPLDSIFLVAHGPDSDADNAKWLSALKVLSERIQKKGHFKSVQGFTLRDDAPAPVRQKAVDQLREAIARTNEGKGHVIVLPVLLAPGGIEGKLNKDLGDLLYVVSDQMLLPDARFSDWIRARTGLPTGPAGLTAPDEKR